MEYIVQEPYPILYSEKPPSKEAKAIRANRLLAQFDVLWKLIFQHFLKEFVSHYIPIVLTDYNIDSYKFTDSEFLSAHPILISEERKWIIDKVAEVTHKSDPDKKAYILMEAQSEAKATFKIRATQCLKAASLKYQMPIFLLPIIHTAYSSYSDHYVENYYNMDITYNLKGFVIKNMTEADFKNMPAPVLIVIKSVWLIFQKNMPHEQVLKSYLELWHLAMSGQFSNIERVTLAYFIKKCKPKFYIKNKNFINFEKQIDLFTQKNTPMDALDQLMEEIMEPRIATAREEARIEGKIEGKLEEKLDSSKRFAAALLDQGGFTITNIAGLTNLTVAEVKKIKMSLSNK